MPPRVRAILLGACTFVLFGPRLGAQGLPNTLTVTSGSSAVAQANQTITTSGTVTINAGSSVTFQAGSTITLQNGFHAATGSSFHAFVATPDFVVTVTPTAGGATLAGGSATYNVTVSSIFGFSGTVYFSPSGVTGLPQGASASFSAASVVPPVNGTSSPISLTITTASAITGNYTFTVIATSLGYPSHLGTSSLTVQDFYLTLSPSEFSVYSLQTATYQLSATGVNGFSGTISVTLQWSSTIPCYMQAGFPSQLQPGASPVTFTLQKGACGNQGTYQFYINATWNGSTRKVYGALLVLPGTGSSSGGPTVSCTGTPNPADTGQTVTFTASPSGTAPYTYSWSGQVSGNGQSASFAPTTPGIYEAAITITDSTNRSASNTCSVNVQEGGTVLTILTSSTLPYGTVSSAYSKTLAASGGTGSYTWSPLSTLPVGLTLSTTGVLSGTPTTAGSYTFYIQVADTGGHSVRSEFALTVATGGAQSSIQVSLAYPQISTSYPGAIHQFTFHFTDPLGSSDISGGQIAFNIDTNAPDLPVCQLDWYVSGSSIDINGIAYGNFGGGQLSSAYCNVYTGESSLTQTAQGYDVSILVSFPVPLPNPLMPAWTRGITQAGVVEAFNPVGAHSLSSRFEIGLAPETMSCGGIVVLDASLSRYADGEIAGAVGAWIGDTGNAPGWQNQVGYAEIVSNSNLYSPIATNDTWSPVTTDYDPSMLPVPAAAPYPTGPAGVYDTIATYVFTNPNCQIILGYGSVGYVEDNILYFYDLGNEFDLTGQAVDPTPTIWDVTLNPPLVSGGTSTATIVGINFGTATGSLNFSSSLITVVPGSLVWGSSTIQVTLAADPSTPPGTYTVQVVSAGGANGQGFQAGNGQSNTSNAGQVPVQSR